MEIRPGQLWLASHGTMTFVIAPGPLDGWGDPTWETRTTFVLDDGARVTEFHHCYPYEFTDGILISECPE